MSEPTVMEIPAAPALAEDTLLLLFDPRSGTIAGEGNNLFHTLAGAVLVELAFQGRIDIDERATFKGRQVHAIAGEAPSDPILRDVWERVERKPTDVHSLILEIGPHLRARVLDRVVERGHIGREDRKVLGLFNTTALVDGGTSRRADLLAPVRAALVDGDEPDPRTAALAALLAASGGLPALYKDIPWSGAVYTRGQELQRGDWGAAAVGESVQRTMAGLIASNLFVTAFVANR
ncbi:GOLPH3/VPS74 family protein [Promicromonospora sp. CA-289599]|uniref:GOLPH3/VPS74 family protein n=1 Tax=Promicromonospora sp. CA-289599 TaxID=3240014 RepID=UPI003D908A50